jgi:dipeptidyl aminopeptidase/acylaminoacyl peptidase
MFTGKASPDAPPVQRLSLNRFLDSIAAGSRRVISYVNAGGDTLRAAVILPPGYVAGRRYPTIAYVYAGEVFRDTSSSMSRVNQTHVFNLQQLAARGYVVVTPSLPLDNAGNDPMQGLAGNVLPAIDRLVAEGISDSARLGVAGNSFGGYTTLAVITQTRRFKAAVAIAAPVNLSSMYGTFDIRRRYSEDAADFPFGVQWAEGGQGRMPTGPWGSAERYVKNSPVFFADRIHTPLLLIHGDQDFVPIGQAEEMFSALNRLGKRVRFARYWGEGHTFKSPANIKSMWNEVFRWFDEHLAPTSPRDTRELDTAHAR